MYSCGFFNGENSSKSRSMPCGFFLCHLRVILLFRYKYYTKERGDFHDDPILYFYDYSCKKQTKKLSAVTRVPTDSKRSVA